MSIRHLGTHDKGIFVGLSGFIAQRKEKSFCTIGFSSVPVFLYPGQRDKIESMMEGAKKTKKKIQMGKERAEK